MINEHTRQSAFLQNLLLRCEGERARPLLERLTQAQHDDRVMRMAVLLPALVGIVALLTYGYAAVLVEDFFLHRSALLLTIQVLGTASLVCMGLLATYWWWRRAMFNPNSEIHCTGERRGSRARAASIAPEGGKNC